MSSETSTETVRLKADTTGRADATDRSVRLQPDDALQPWQLFTLAGLIGATVVVFVSTGQTPAGIILLSLTIFTAAVVGVAAWRTLSPLIGSDEPLGAQVLGGRTRAALEREKTLVLRSIKELEFDRAMGKVSDKDFAEMSARLRARAAGLMRQLDAGSALSRADREGDLRSAWGAPCQRPVEPDRARPARRAASDVEPRTTPTRDSARTAARSWRQRHETRLAFERLWALGLVPWRSRPSRRSRCPTRR